MSAHWWCGWLFIFSLCNSSTGWLEERPNLESVNGNLYLTSGRDKNITLKTLGEGHINVNDINLLHTVWAASNASQLIERWKNGILDDVESTLQRLTRIVEGPGGLLRKVNALSKSEPRHSNDSIPIAPESDPISVSPGTYFPYDSLTGIMLQLRRLENKVRTITTKLRINECNSDPCQNGGTCIDLYDSFSCHCPPEWEGDHCTVDVNECERLAGKPSGCQNGATCVNALGTFSCTCAQGWHGYLCTTQKSACDQSNDVDLCGNGVCLKNNSPLGYTCICKLGWDHLGENDPSCRKDIDECSVGRYPCSVNPLVACHNVPGTFFCGVCPAGYTGDGYKCQDIDECLLNNGGCSQTPLVDCINTLGSRTCGPCPVGYQGDGITCFFVGNCNVNNGGCHSLATCREDSNAKTYCLCPEGYEGSGLGPQGCVPVRNACRSSPCVHGSCFSQGEHSFKCHCNKGYSGPLCDVAVDPCIQNPCLNGGTCRKNTNGSRYCECTSSFSGPLCATAKSACGGFFRSETGSIEFPVEAGSKYDHSLSCAWVILTNRTLVLNVTFTKFALETAHGSDECRHDYVQIHDGRSAGSQIFGRYCGDQLPNNGTIISTHNSLYIWFHSDSTINSDGFALTWSSVEPQCGEEIETEYGSISSPGYPGKYPVNRDCYWTIKVSPGKRIALHFIMVAIEEHPTCEYDYLEVNETNYAGPHQLAIFCNHSNPAILTSTGDQVTIRFHSDNSGTDSGFHLSFLSIPGSPDCGGVFTADTAEIASPGYHSGQYRSDAMCEWEIRLPPGSRIRVQWLDFDVERSRNCMFDSVQIYEGPSIDSPLKGKYCGNNLPPAMTIHSNIVLIRFETDTNLEEKGFILKYEVECGGTFTNPTGVITSPFYPNHYPASKDCKYLISLPPEKAVVLTFEFMDIEEGTTIDSETECYFDKLEIRDGDSENSTLLKKLCGSEKMMPTEPIYSTHNYMFLEFFTDSNIHNMGFKANYSTIDRECGGIYREAPGSISFTHSLDQSSYSYYKQDCIWIIHAPYKHAIQINWVSFPSRTTSVNEECTRNYIQLEERGDYEDKISMGKYCAFIPPPQMMTTQGNDLTITYHQNGGSEDIQLSFNFINDTNTCGGHYYADSGYIRSPNYPDAKYPKNKECVWIIEAKNKYLVTLNFLSFKIEKSRLCSYDYLEVRSGSQENSPLLGKFCGTQVQDELTSMTNQMYIKFVSDNSLQEDGFEIRWHSSTAGCGGNLHTSSGAIISPNYPQNYYHRATCTWNIRVAAGSVVRITFIDFDIEEHPKCLFDYLEIADIINGYAQNPARYCGSTIPPIVMTHSNQIKLTFRTDLLTNSRGFHLRYATECVNEVEGFQGVIESPNFPDSYENLSNCTWTITVPAGNAINITFSHFDIDSGLRGNCNQDYLKIQEGDDTPNTELVTKCGTEEDVLPLKISSKQRRVFVNFVTDRRGVAGGFRLEWYVNGCSRRFTKPAGTFTSPGYPNGDKLDKEVVECIWLIEVELDKSIEITFPKIDNTKTRNCLSGSIEVYNGPNEKAPLLIHNLCYSDTPTTFTSTGNRMTIKYMSETSYASHGFTANYHSVPIKCGGKFSGQSGVIHSTNYPKNYPHNENCEWLITVDRNHAINLTFVDLDLERSRNCTDDYIEIHDGPILGSPILGKHCHAIDALPFYVSSGNQMLVVMRTDALVTAKGFMALYNRTCGARITINGQGAIQSSPTLHTSLSLLNCTWILSAEDPGDKVTLTFSHINIQESDDCSNNHIEVYEGDGTQGVLLGTICSNKIPTPFYSTGNTLTIQMTAEYGHSVGDKFEASYSTFSNACGGNYTAESGTIASPNYPLSYPSQADCIWIIQNAPGNRISLTFDEFELTESEHCNVDYVEVRETNGIGKLRGVFCGKNVDSITSAQPLWIRFKSAPNTLGNPKGFKAEYNLLFGDELTGDFGEIASPMYPVPHRKSSDYWWRITVDFDFVIRIEFLDFHLDSYEDYCYSSVKIYDGYNEDAPEMKELCGIAIPEEPITSSSNIMYIQFDSIYDQVGNWFLLKWTKIPRPTNTGEIQVVDSNKYIVLTTTNSSYTFHSPGYPDGYAENLKYSWTFVTAPGSHVLLRFLSMNLEESENCVTDYVAIYNGHVTTFNSNENLIKKVCLSNATSTSYSGQNTMTVQFVSDSYLNKTGFSAIALEQCGGLLEKTFGVIQFNTTSGYSRVRPYIYACEWVVKVRPGRRIRVNIKQYNIESSQPKTDDNSCRSNYLVLKNGETASSPLLGIGKYCNGVIPPVQNTTGNYLYIKLAVSFASVNLKIIFKELGHDCGGRFDLSRKSEIEITSPNYPNIPTPHTECFWTFMSVDEQRMAIHFVERFDLAFSENCEKEYVEFRDGGTETSELLGRYCKNMAPSSVTTKGNILFVHYYTDLPEPRNGFKAVITSGDVCGGIERNPQGGVISSPNYPDSYDTKSQLCTWWIMAPHFTRGIKLQFQDLELPTRRECNDTDHVTIYEKVPETEIGKFCGRNKPGVIDILTSEAMVTFVSSFTNTRLPYSRGFRLNYTFSHDGCGGNLNGMMGMFQTVGYPRPTTYRYCSWKINVPEGFQVQVDIIDLDLAGVTYSSGSHVSFHHDPDNVATIAVVRESSQSMTIASSTNFMSIYYISTGGHRGMKARFRAVYPAPCGGKLNSWNDVLTNPRSAPFNQSAFYCKWTIEQPEDVESIQRDSMTLAITISGLISKGIKSIVCRNYLNYISIKGDEPVARVCGNWTADRVTVTSPFKSYSIQALNASNAERMSFTVTYKWHKCGGILTGPSHKIQALKNITYPVYCAWKVKYPDVDNSILVTFEKMNLGSCDKSYIQIKGRTFRSPTLGKFCGNEKPPNIVSPTNEIMIEYYASEDVGDFEIHINPADYACGGIVTGKQSEIRSPGFPNNYPNNTECVWEIIANNGFHVGLNFIERFHLETSANCENDYVEVSEWIEDGLNDRYESLAKVCGRIAPDKPFNTTTRKMKVKFHSNDLIEGEGFKAVWHSNCGGVYVVSEMQKYIESPNFPMSYPINSICNYTLIAKENEQIIVDFKQFTLEGMSANCPYDNVTIRTFSGDWMRGENIFCGVNSPGRRIARGRMEIVFRSDSSVNRAGFKFGYRLNDCGGTVTTPRILNPIMENNPQYFEYTSCHWLIKAPVKKSVLLRFEQFNISSTIENCLGSFAKVFEGNSTAKTNLKGTFCGDLSKNLPVLQSLDNIMTLMLHTSPYGEKSYAFKVAVLFVNSPEQGCGGNIELTSTTPFKTQNTDYYDPLQDCHWLITAPQGYNIEFTITDIDLKDTPFNDTTVNKRMSCNSDYIEVRDGGPYAEIIGHYCGNTVPATITSTSNLLWIRFVSDSIGQGRGVKGSLKAATSPCGVADLYVGNTTQILTSPGYPQAYPSEITCRWVIHGTTGRLKRVRIVFEDFKLADSTLCESEFFKIVDLNNREVISEGFGENLIVGGSGKRDMTVVIASRIPQSFLKYCGSLKPHDYYSNYKDVEITYKMSPSNLKKKGFKLEYGKASCSRNYTAIQGRIIHDDVGDCWMTIEVPKNFTINIYFNHFFLPGGPDCSKAKMEIREGGSDGHLIQSVCNYETPEPVFSTGNRLSIHTFVDKERSYFNNIYDFTYTSTNSGRGCGGDLYNYGGVFTSPFYPNSYRNRSTCTWNISVPKGMKVSLHLRIFDIGPKSMCDTDYLSIFNVNANGENGEAAITYCGGDMPAEFTGQSNRIAVTYVTSVNNGGSGWLAHFAAVS
ncbi:cubilin [Phymastichus coffea]|uniref:cubilin n=1 Tax=Phymastichus coffea TaxID=108790 RepID=UPI00273CD404|nr:cubilin [Phymastichus coffea]